MRDFTKEALGAIKTNLAGLNSFCRLVIYELLPYCDYSSGIVSISSLDKLASDDFHVDSLRGRQKEVVNGDKIRNAFRAIKKAKPDHFLFKTINQRIVIEMPFIRELYQSFYGQMSEVAAVLVTDVATACPCGKAA